MRLLVITQALDLDDPTLSAYHRMVEEVAHKFDSVIVICLKKGRTNLPSNVRVLSLGKESAESRWKYIKNFFRYIWDEKENYDRVFVHMNQEYILLGGVVWKFLGKRIYMWRNHHAGSLLTDIASLFCTNVFCTSKFSYTAKYKKTVIMPVGIDRDIFKPDHKIRRLNRSILFLARMAPVKKPDLLLGALKKLKEKKIPFTASFYGDPLPKDMAHYAELQGFVYRNNLTEDVKFYPGVPNDKTPEIYSAHEYFINLSSSGMYDKTIFEAMACGALVVTSNKNLSGILDSRFMFEESDEDSLTNCFEAVLSIMSAEKEKVREKNLKFAKNEHSLSSLGEKLSDIIKKYG